MSDSTDAQSVHFELTKTEPLSFEARMKGEKAMIGYPVSGHPLDGISEFIRARSKNLGPIYTFITSLDTLASPEVIISESVPVADESEVGDAPVMTEATPENDAPPPPELPQIDEEKEESIYAQLIGVVANVRKMQTKSGGMMLVAVVETVGFDFRVVIFPKDYEKYESKIEEDTIVVVDGRVKFDREAGEISIFPSAGFGKKRMDSDGAVKCFSISAFREMAFSKMRTSDTDTTGASPDAVPFLDVASGTTSAARYIIDVPSFWTKEDLLDLRDHLEHSEAGLTPIWIRIHGLEKDTKFAIASVAELEQWLEKKGV